MLKHLLVLVSLCCALNAASINHSTSFGDSVSIDGIQGFVESQRLVEVAIPPPQGTYRTEINFDVFAQFLVWPTGSETSEYCVAVLALFVDDSLGGTGGNQWESGCEAGVNGLALAWSISDDGPQSPAYGNYNAYAGLLYGDSSLYQFDLSVYGTLDVTYFYTPEPSTFALFAVGLAGLAVSRRGR